MFFFFVLMFVDLGVVILCFLENKIFDCGMILFLNGFFMVNFFNIWIELVVK